MVPGHCSKGSRTVSPICLFDPEIRWRYRLKRAHGGNVVPILHLVLRSVTAENMATTLIDLSCISCQIRSFQILCAPIFSTTTGDATFAPAIS